MIIDKSYFTGKLFIPNVQAVPDIHGGTQPNNQDKLTAAIVKYERLLLINALGAEQYDLLVAVMGSVTDYVPGNKWYDLVNGKTYDNKRFDGLRDIIGYYVYVNFLKYESVQFNTTGLERAESANSTPVLAEQRVIDYWNEFVSMYQYHHGCGCILYGSYTPNFVSLYQFLNENQADYSIGNFGFYQIQNILGI